MGIFSGSAKTTTNEKFDTGPSSFQKPYLDETFGAAKSIYDNTKGSSYYEGDTYAGMSDEAKAALAKLKAYAGDQGMDTASQLSQIGQGAAGYSTKAGAMTDKFAAMAAEDPTQANIAAAGQYADNPYLEGQIDANARDITRNLTEQQLPGIDRAASANGNINSSRAGIAAGVARRGAEDRIGDISASMRGDAYDRGLTLAQNDRSTNLSATGQAASAYGNLASFGVDALGKSTDAAYDAFGQINTANAAEQADSQGDLTAAFDKWKGEDTREMDLLARYASLTNGSQWGQSGTSSGTTKTKSSGSVLGQIMGAASTAASIYTGMK